MGVFSIVFIVALTMGLGLLGDCKSSHIRRPGSHSLATDIAAAM